MIYRRQEWTANFYSSRYRLRAPRANKNNGNMQIPFKTIPLLIQKYLWSRRVLNSYLNTLDRHVWLFERNTPYNHRAMFTIEQQLYLCGITFKYLPGGFTTSNIQSGKAKYDGAPYPSTFLRRKIRSESRHANFMKHLLGLNYFEAKNRSRQESTPHLTVIPSKKKTCPGF